MLLAALAIAGLLAVQTEQNTTQVEDVVVIGRPLDQQVRNFLDDVSVPDRNLRIARFQKNICVGAVNMREPMAQYVVDRVSQIGLEIGLNAGEPGCRPNILIIASTDSSALSRAMVDARPRVFNPRGADMVRNRSALERFQSIDTSIRWWHVSVPVDSTSGQIATRLPGENPPVVRGANSRLRSEIRNDINRVIVILDFNKLEGMNAKQIADFTAMVAFAQVDLDSDFSGYDSILSLMSDHQYAGISTWDMSYLRALYSSELNQLAKNQQIGEIANIMIRQQQKSNTSAADVANAHHPF